MDRVDPTRSATQTSGIQPNKTSAHALEVQKSSAGGKTAGGPSIGVGQKGQHTSTGSAKNGQQLSHKFVPWDQRMSTLEEVFDDKALKRMGIVECVTCATRTYQDQSDDAGVSFQAPTHLNPSQAASAVVAHEMEHVSHEQVDAKEEGKEVIGQSVQIFQSVCPECGKSYVSGGVTKTTTANKNNPYKEAINNKVAGNLVDMML